MSHPPGPPSRRDNEDSDSLLMNGDPTTAGNYVAANTPLQDVLDTRTTKTIFELTKGDDTEAVGHIRVHGWMHKQGQRVIKGPIHKSYKRRYFALEGSKMYYFHEPVDCRKYFTSRNPELVVGVMDLKDAFKLEQSQRMDLPYRGIAIHTKKRVWLLCPESDADFQMFFNALEEFLVSKGSGYVVTRDLPNVRVYDMKGRTTYRIFYFLFVLTALVELAAIGLWFPIGFEPCVQNLRGQSCEFINAQRANALDCGPEPFNGVYSPPQWYLEVAGVEDVVCFRNNNIGRWISYFAFFLAEIISVLLGFLYYLGMWSPVRRGAKYLKDFTPVFPEAEWPTVDVLLCHYSEPVEDTLATLDAIMSMEYPAHLLHVWICDDGYCKSKWGNDAKVPDVTVNRGVIENAGDVRHEVAQFMFDLVDVTDDIEVTEWRKQHSSVNIPTERNPRVVKRADCAVGSVRDDYKYPGFFHVSFVGRVKPKVHHSKAGNINNVLYNEGAEGHYAMILDNDMKPHKMFVQATLPFFFDDACKGRAGRERNKRNAESILNVECGRYSDDISRNQVGYVQTPQYFEDCLQLQLGDPCGHRNATFFDAVQTGMDGYEMASFAGTNAMFRRQALDSVGGIQYGSLTEDAFTGKMMVDRGWKGLYFRKDLEGEDTERIRLAEGAVPESVAASLAQRKRWAKGNFQIFLRKSKDLSDPEWIRPDPPVPAKRKYSKFFKWVIFMNLTVYPIGSFPALFFFYVIIYFLFSGDAPIFTPGLRLLVALVPKLMVQSVLVALSNRTVDNNDVMRSQQTWFSYGFCHVMAVFETIYWKITGKEASWANTGALGGNSPMELPNLLVYFATLFGVIWATVRYFSGFDNTSSLHGTPLFFASVFMGFFILMQLGPMVRMSLQEYFGWSHRALTDRGNIVGSFTMAFVVSLVCVWVYVEDTNGRIY